MNNPLSELETTQRWMQAVITHPDGVAAGIASEAARQQIDVSLEGVEHVIEPSNSQSGLERLAVYGNAYFARLLECLRDEFPALTRAVGEEPLNAFGVGYLQTYPSRSYTLAQLAAKFPQYLAETRPQRVGTSDEPDGADFLIELATLERTYSEVFDGPGAEHCQLLSAADLLAIPPERWPAARLQTVDCLRLLAFRFPVHEYATAVRQDRLATPPRPSPTFLVVTRRDFVVRRFPVSETEHRLLQALHAGQSIADSIAQVVEADDVDSTAEKLRIWFHNWTANGFFQNIVIECKGSR